MRGKASKGNCSISHVGITPAYAGKSRKRCRHRHPKQDHPRLCGEKLSGAAATVVTTGSPPPMRGKGMRTIKAFPDQRITPAYAGKRDTLHQIRCCSRDHPRLCGEKWEDRRSSATDNGITPAYAGKSRSYVAA